MSELDHYDYPLPSELIAQSPLLNRADARLLIVDRARGRLEHAHVRDLPEWLSAGDLLVRNDTRVVPARLLGRRSETGGAWEGLFLNREPDGAWQVLSRTRGKLRPGEAVTLWDLEGRDAVRLWMLEKRNEGVWLARPDSELDSFAILEQVGRVPLPPYIRKGEMIESDRERYQTVYSRQPGAVAAPTAGLHFTPRMFEQLAARGIQAVNVTLHVGLGTFRPIAVERLDEHQMHSEWGELTPQTAAELQACRARSGRIVAIGTTSVRVLETAAAQGALAAWSGDTRLFIRPPYQFRAVDALLTNFHLPRSTLLVLVRTFGGDALIQHAYAEAIREQYRFFSYGDAMLIL